MTTNSEYDESVSELLALLAEEGKLFLRDDRSRLRLACASLQSTRGKLLRGRMTIASAQTGSNPRSRTVIVAACAVELLHLASLAHDDIIDSGTVRRGEPTTGVRFGERLAGLAGGAVFARATELISECGSSSLNLFAQTAVELCDGGMHELRGIRNTSRTVDDYLTTAGNKTASAFVLAARLGSQLAGADDEDVALTGKFGYEFGMAYQIWDDLVDLLADSNSSGKSPSTDLNLGVYSLPVLYAIAESAEVRDRLNDGISPSGGDGSVAALLRETDGISRAVETAHEYSQRATSVLKRVPRTEELQRLLQEIQRRYIGLL